MFSFFKRSSNLVTDIQWLGVDIHSHLLPGIDDGAQDLTESITYIRQLQSLGFDKLLCTPHIFTELYPNSPETIMPALALLSKGLKEEGLDVEIGAAAEYMIDDTFKITDNLLCLPGKHILIEMSYLSETPNIEQVIFDLQVKGYNIILAHPERYNFYHHELHRYDRLKEIGCLFQLNLLAVVGYYGKSVKQAALYLLEHQMYDLTATDLHHHKHLSVLDKAVKSGDLYKLLGEYDFRNKELFFNALV